MREVYTIGQANALFLKPGIAKVPFSIPINQVQTSAFLLNCLRSSGVLPWLTLGFGFTDDSGTHYAWQVQDCKIDRLDVSLEAGQFLTATLNGTGGAITNLTTLAAANLSQTPMMSYEAVLLKGGSAWESKQFRMSINNNVDVQSVIPGAAPSSNKRGWAYQTEGNQQVSGEITRFAKSAISMQADTLSGFAIALTCTDIAGGMSPNTLTFSISGAKFGSEKMATSPGGDFLFTLPFMATGISAS
jgi:hypothetical protein